MSETSLYVGHLCNADRDEDSPLGRFRHSKRRNEYSLRKFTRTGQKNSKTKLMTCKMQHVKLMKYVQIWSKSWGAQIWVSPKLENLSKLIACNRWRIAISWREIAPQRLKASFTDEENLMSLCILSWFQENFQNI